MNEQTFTSFVKNDTVCDFFHIRLEHTRPRRLYATQTETLGVLKTCEIIMDHPQWKEHYAKFTCKRRIGTGDAVASLYFVSHIRIATLFAGIITSAARQSVANFVMWFIHLTWCRGCVYHSRDGEIQKIHNKKGLMKRIITRSNSGRSRFLVATNYTHTPRASQISASICDTRSEFK